MSIDSLPQHAPIPHFEVAEDCLLVGGKPLTRLAQEVGRTPFYAYDRTLISRRVQQLRRALPSGIRLHYAIKANPMPALLRFIRPLVDGLDVASAGELRLALEAGADPATVSFAGPGKQRDEIAAAVEAGITINLESEHQLGLADAAGRECGRRPRIALRVNPDFELKTSGMKMGGGCQQFGVDAEQVPALLERIGDCEVEFQGFHIFCGSQNLQPQAICEAQTATVELALRLAAAAPAPVRMLNIGGGFGIPYFPGDRPLDLAPIAANLARLLPQVRSALPEAEVILELGRYLVGEAGIYVCRVLERKRSRGQLFLITDGGLHHHLAASGNFGQVIRKNYPVIVGNKVHGGERETASVVGPLCTPLDLLAKQLEMARADIDDLIVVFQSGAYGYSASPHGFLSHPPPLEVLV